MGQSNIVWTEVMKANAATIRDRLHIQPVERGPNAWVSKTIAAALADWAQEIRAGSEIDKRTALAYAEQYTIDVMKVWGSSGEKRPVLNASFKDDMQQHIEIIGAVLDRLNMPHAKARTGYNRAAIVYIALEKYAKKLELTAGIDEA